LRIQDRTYKSGHGAQLLVLTFPEILTEYVNVVTAEVKSSSHAYFYYILR
jgi:hypothetical protein